MSETDSESGLTSHRAPHIARALCAHALIWAHTLASTTHRDPVTFESSLLEEIVAYSLCLLELRCDGLDAAQRERFLALVHHECAVLKRRRLDRRQRHGRLLPPPAPAQYDQHYLACRSGRLNQDLFEEFRRCTGLGSDVLVGEGENLAALVFYIVLHTVLSTPTALTREQTLKMLRAARDGRIRLETLMAKMIRGCPRPAVLQGPSPIPTLNAHER